jgi:predicted Zn-dependent protease
MQALHAVVATAKRLAPEAEVVASLEAGRSANTRFAKGGITSTGDVTESKLTISLAIGKRHARIITNQLDPRSVADALVRLRAMARLAPEDPEHLPPLGPQKYSNVPGAYDPTVDKLGAAARADVARASLAAAGNAGTDIAGFIDHGTSSHTLITSKGLAAEYVATTASFTATARTPDGTGSGWAGVWGNRWREIDTGTVAQVAVDKAVKSRNPRALSPGHYTVVLEPAAVQELLYFLIQAMDARLADEGRSFFARAGGGTRVGERLFGEHITLRSDPTQLHTPGAPFDDEGLPLAPLTWIDRGRMAALTYSRYWAAKQGKVPTGSPRVFDLAAGTAADTDLLAGVKKGILITRFWYTRWLDPQTVMVTGLTRDGVFLIENGAVTSPVNNFRFNESPVNMLKNADALTRTTKRLGDARVPALRTHEFNLASVSQAV